MVSYSTEKLASPVISAVLMLVLGVLILVLSGDQIKFIGGVVAGLFLIILGAVPMIQTKKADAIGIVKVILGIILLIAPVFIADVVFIIFGIILIIAGLLTFVSAVKDCSGNERTMGLVYGILLIVLGILIGFFFDPYKTIIAIIFIVSAIISLVKAFV